MKSNKKNKTLNQNATAQKFGVFEILNYFKVI